MEILGIVLVNPKDPKNVGLVARSMASFGVYNLIIVGKYDEKFLKKARQVSCQGIIVLDKVKFVDSLEDVKGKKIGTISIFDNKRYGFKLVPVWELNKIKGEYYLVFGRENYGLTREELEMCDIISTIPTNDKYGVLNLAMSVTIYLYELTKEKFKNILESS